MAGPEQNRIEPSVGAIRRRDFIALAAAVLASGSVRGLAQAATRRPLMAVLLGGSQTTVQGWRGGLPDGLQSLGYVEHRDYDAEYRYADGDLGRLPRLAAELASLNPDVIVVASTAAALAAKRAAPSIPIVVAAAPTPSALVLPRTMPDQEAMSPGCWPDSTGWPANSWNLACNCFLERDRLECWSIIAT